MTCTTRKKAAKELLDTIVALAFRKLLNEDSSTASGYETLVRKKQNGPTAGWMISFMDRGPKYEPMFPKQYSEIKTIPQYPLP